MAASDLRQNPGVELLIMTASLASPKSARLDRAIARTEELIAEVVMIDPIATTLLGLAKAELVAKKAVQNGEVLAFSRRRYPRQ